MARLVIKNSLTTGVLHDPRGIPASALKTILNSRVE